MKKALVIIASCGIFWSCSCTKKDVAQNQTTMADSATTLSFFSRGAGIDNVAYQMLTDTMLAFAQKHTDTIAYSSTRWGREGEIDLCFPVQQNKHSSEFYAFLERNFRNHENVHYSKTLTCEERSSD